MGTPEELDAPCFPCREAALGASGTDERQTGSQRSKSELACCTHALVGEKARTDCGYSMGIIDESHCAPFQRSTRPPCPIIQMSFALEPWMSWKNSFAGSGFK